MSHRTSGRALVITRTDYAYEAHVTLADGMVHCSRVYRKLGRGADAFYSRAADRMWPPSELREVRWLTTEGLDA